MSQRRIGTKSLIFGTVVFGAVFLLFAAGGSWLDAGIVGVGFLGLASSILPTADGPIGDAFRDRVSAKVARVASTVLVVGVVLLLLLQVVT